MGDDTTGRLRYRLLTGPDDHAFCERVSEALAEGYVLYGSPAITFDGDNAHCREGYVDAVGLLAHLDNVGAVLQEALKIADITRLEVHGPAAEIDKLRGPLAGLKPQFFILEPGGIRR